MPNNQVSEEEKKKQEELHKKVVKTLGELGADVKAAPQVFVDKDGTLKISAVPFVTEKEQIEKPTNPDTGKSKNPDGNETPKQGA